MGCRHKKELSFHLWCTPCAEKVAGPKPACKWKHGNYAKSKCGWDTGGPFKVLDSEMNLFGIATETPSWSEWLIFRDGSGSAALFKKMKLVQINDEDDFFAIVWVSNKLYYICSSEKMVQERLSLLTHEPKVRILKEVQDG